MIAGVRGVLEATGPDWVHLQVGGITLRISVPASSVAELGEPGGQVYLHTNLRIRDDQPVLYGFTTRAAMEVFLLLLGISGVGPRHSLGLLSSLGVAGLQRAIESGDVAALSTAPGVGRRTASRVVLELKGKLETVQEGGAPTQASNNVEVVEALTALGYSTAEARRAVNDLDSSSNLTVEDKIRLALQQMGGG
ncbi:MAG TPA: Holliday junction branch migration protein RuvA [Dehalococcoidia bacterium]|nr:Holliday junction branch migration protein RuvA [Dehalococcoidia bacterium]